MKEIYSTLDGVPANKKPLKPTFTDAKSVKFALDLA